MRSARSTFVWASAMPEAKPDAKVPCRTGEERDPARDDTSTGGTAPLAYFGITRKGRSQPNNGDSLLVAEGATPGSTAEGEVSGGVRSRSHARRGVHFPPRVDAE